MSTAGKRSKGEERSRAGKNKQPTVLTWTVSDKLLEKITAELRSKSAAETGGAADEVHALPTSDGDRDHYLGTRRTGYAAAAGSELETPPGFLTVHSGRRWS